MNKWPWLLLVCVLIVLDQATKFWATQALLPYQPVPVMPMVNITLAFNSGAAFSFLSHAGEWHRWLFAGFSLVMSVVLLVCLLKTLVSMRLQSLALSLILGGAIGNLIDRAYSGYVVDFIDVYYKHYHWPVFNVADSAICVGAVLLLFGLRKVQGNR
jgi:signal peptidase II